MRGGRRYILVEGVLRREEHLKNLVWNPTLFFINAFVKNYLFYSSESEACKEKGNL